MFTNHEKIYYIDLYDGVIREGRFLGYDGNGLWIKLNKQPFNKFVYTDVENTLISNVSSKAEENLTEIRNKMKEKLLNNNSYIDDIFKKISIHEGNFYAGIIKDILEERTKLIVEP